MTATDPRPAPASHRPGWLPSHQEPHQGSHQASHQRSHQAPPQPPEPTHRIVTPPTSHPSHQPSHHPGHTTPESEWEDGPLTARERIADAFAGLRFVRSSPGSLLDQIEYARDGAYTTSKSGPWRLVNIWYARLVAVPGLAICYFIGWAFFTRLSRAVISVAVAVPLLVILNDIPIVELVIPDWADVTTWF